MRIPGVTNSSDMPGVRNMFLCEIGSKRWFAGMIDVRIDLLVQRATAKDIPGFVTQYRDAIDIFFSTLLATSGDYCKYFISPFDQLCPNSSCRFSKATIFAKCKNLNTDETYAFWWGNHLCKCIGEW